MHVHVYRPGKQTTAVREKILSRGSLPDGIAVPSILNGDIVNQGFGPEEFLQNAIANGVAQGLLLPVAPFGTRPEVVRKYNQWHAEIQTTRRGELISLGTINPFMSEKAAAAELDFIRENFIGVKFHSFLQGFNPLAPELGSLFEEISARNLSMFWHTGAPEIYARTNTLPEHLVKIYDAYCAKDNLATVWAHLGAQRFGDYFLDYLAEHENIFLDFAYTYALDYAVYGTELEGKPVEHDGRWDFYFDLTNPRYLDKLLKKLGPKRFFMGSDYPYTSMVVMMRAVNRMFEVHELNSEERNAILSGNARRFFSLMGEIQPDKSELLSPFC